MNRTIQNRLLEQIGIQKWVSRRTPDPILQSQAPLFNAGCLVILPEKMPKEAIEQRKILSGMLKVLDLDPQKMCVAWIVDSHMLKSPKLLLKTITDWAPFKVLILGTGLKESFIGLEKMTHYTFHPKELMDNPESKRKAYQDLLYLKEELQQARAT